MKRYTFTYHLNYQTSEEETITEQEACRICPGGENGLHALECAIKTMSLDYLTVLTYHKGKYRDLLILAHEIVK